MANNFDLFDTDILIDVSRIIEPAIQTVETYKRSSLAEHQLHQPRSTNAESLYHCRKSIFYQFSSLITKLL